MRTHILFLSLTVSIASLHGAAASSCSAGASGEASSSGPVAFDGSGLVTRCYGEDNPRVVCKVVPLYSAKNPHDRSHFQNSRKDCGSKEPAEFLTGINVQLTYGSKASAVKFMSERPHEYEFPGHDGTLFGFTPCVFWAGDNEHAYLQSRSDKGIEKLARSTMARVYAASWLYYFHAKADDLEIRSERQEFTELDNEWEIMARRSGTASLCEKSLLAFDRPELLMLHVDDRVRQGVKSLIPYLQKPRKGRWDKAYAELINEYGDAHPAWLKEECRGRRVMDPDAEVDHAFMVDTPAIVALLKSKRDDYRAQHLVAEQEPFVWKKDLQG